MANEQLSEGVGSLINAKLTLLILVSITRVIDEFGCLEIIYKSQWDETKNLKIIREPGNL